jgi:hypothetical protein
MSYAASVLNDLNFISHFCIRKILKVGFWTSCWPDIFVWALLSFVFDEPRSHVANYTLFDTVYLF